MLAAVAITPSAPVLVPELAVSGYPPEDLLFHSGMRLQVARSLERLKQEVRGITLIAGYPEYEGTKIFNSAEIYVDFNSHVKKGQVLAKLDPTTLQAALDQAQATLAQSEALAQAAGATASGAPQSSVERAHLFMLRNDLKNFVLLGDPAARMSLSGSD